MRPFYEDSRRLSKSSLNIHMSRVNFDKQYWQIILMKCSEKYLCQQFSFYLYTKLLKTLAPKAHGANQSMSNNI